MLHGALLDAQLLAQVYVELLGGRQIGLGLVDEAPVATTAAVSGSVHTERPVRPPRHFAASAGELAAHAAFMTRITDPIWGVAASG